LVCCNAENLLLLAEWQQQPGLKKETIRNIEINGEIGDKKLADYFLIIHIYPKVEQHDTYKKHQYYNG